MSKGKKVFPSIKRISPIIFCLCFFGGTLQAAQITIGSMTYDSSINASVIVDSANQRDWLRWDMLKGLTFEQTFAETQTGSYVGWTLANYQDAQLFTDALVPSGKSNSCDAATNEGCWSDNDPANSYHQLLGDSFHTGAAYDYVFFDSNLAGNAGYIKSEKIGANYYLTKHANEWNSQTANSIAVNNDIGWLLYRDHPAPAAAVNIYEPNMLSLIFTCLMGLLIYKRKRRDGFSV